MKNFYVDFNKSTRYTLYPTRFVTKMIFIQLLVTTFLLFFLIIGESYLTYNQLTHCEIYNTH